MSRVDVTTSPDINFQGRWSSKHPRFAIWGGSTVHFRTASPLVVLSTGPRTDCEMMWKVGKNPPRRREVRIVKECILADDPEDVGERNIEVVLAEWGGKLEVRAIKILEGYTIEPLPTSKSPPRYLLFSGASQTSGFSPWRFHPSPLPYGALSAWPLVFSRLLREEGVNVQTTMIARPGMRLCSRDGPGMDVYGLDQRFWQGWDEIGGIEEVEKPECVFISIGSNDFGSKTPGETFVSAYRMFLKNLHSRYTPGLKHLVILSPFGFFRSPNDPSKRTAVYEPETQEMITSLSKEWADQGYPEKLWHVDTDGWMDGTNTPDGLHPDEKGHERIARRLEDWTKVHIPGLFPDS